jgi:hypothetical protein
MSAIEWPKEIWQSLEWFFPRFFKISRKSAFVSLLSPPGGRSSQVNTWFDLF